MKKPKLLDLYSGAGGAGFGYHLAGFDVVGVDLKNQPRYPFTFHQADALECLARLIESGEISEYAAIHASPPCQAHTSLKSMWNSKEHVDLIAPTRDLLQGSGLPWVMENVPGAPMELSLLLCGTMFGLGASGAELRRHRLFESSIYLMGSRCQHGRSATIGVYGGHARNRTRTLSVNSDCARDSRRKFDKGQPDFTVEDARAAMGIEWMTLAELCQAIPPAYTEHIGRQLIDAINRKEAA